MVVRMQPLPSPAAPVPKTALTTETLGYLFGFLGVFIFSFSLPFTRVAVRELNPTFVGLGRALIAATLSILALVLTRQPIPKLQQFRGLVITAFGVVVGFPLFSAIALRFVPSAHGAIVNALMPLLTAILGALVSRERPSPLFWVAAVIGSFTVIGFVLISSGTHIELGDVAMLGAVTLGAMGYVAGARMSRQIGSWQTICWANVIAAPFLIPPVIWAAGHNAANPSPQAWLAFGYLGVFSMFLGFFAWYRGLAMGGIARVSQVQLIQAFLTIMWSGLLLGEVITPLMFVAALIVVAAIFVARKAPINK